MLLIEARFATALWTAHEAERAVADVRQHLCGDRPEILGELALRDFAFRVDDLVRVGKADCGERLDFLRRSTLRGHLRRLRLFC